MNLDEGMKIEMYIPKHAKQCTPFMSALRFMMFMRSRARDYEFDIVVATLRAPPQAISTRL